VGIPVTKRGVSESFWVITGTTSNSELSRDIAIAAQSTATVVILMGTKKLPEIVKAYLSAGKRELPIAIIQSGTTKDQKIVAGTIQDIQQKAAFSGIAAPAIIVVGEVVKESYQLMDIYNSAVLVSK
jgi:uroporphyrin-III C-methyltransferase